MQDRAKIIIETTSQSLVRAETRSRRAPFEGVQSLWRRHGWLPPTEVGKDFRASLRNTVDRLAVSS